MSEWTDERIATELAAIANENFDHLVILRMSQTIVPLIRRMRDEMQVEIARLENDLAERTKQLDRILQAYQKSLEEKYRMADKHYALLAWARRAYIAIKAIGPGSEEWHLVESAPPEVRDLSLPAGELLAGS